jgi:hypothetical protein
MICDKYRGKNTGPQCVKFPPVIQYLVVGMVAQTEVGVVVQKADSPVN